MVSMVRGLLEPNLRLFYLLQAVVLLVLRRSVGIVKLSHIKSFT
jgi:hypothetical protein